MPGIHHLAHVWRPQSFYFTLPVSGRYSAECFCAFVLPDIERNLRDGKRMNTLRDIYRSASIVTLPNGRDKKLPESKPSELPIRLVRQAMYPATSFRLVT
jgi:hypothetical protein